MFLDHTQRRTTVGRTPLDEWSAHRRDLYLTKHDTYNRQISMPRSLRQADHSSRGVLPTVVCRCVWSRNIKNRCSIYIYDISSLRVKDYNVSRKLIIAGCTDGILFTDWYILCWVWWRCKGMTCWNCTPFLKCRDENVLHWLHKPYRAEAGDQNHILADSSLHQEVSVERGTLSTQRVSQWA